MQKTTIKPLCLSVGVAMAVIGLAATPLYAHWDSSMGGGTAPTTADAPKMPNDTNGQYTDAQVQAAFLNTGRPPNVTAMQWPNEAFKYSGGRFGEMRGGRPHTGIDLSTRSSGVPLLTGDTGTVAMTRSALNNGAGNYVVVKRDNRGKGGIQDTFRYLHMAAPSPLSSGSKITSLGTVIGQEGNSGAGISDIHLHIDYLVPMSRTRSTWIESNKGVYEINGVAKHYSFLGLRYTDPTPYYDRDQLYTGRDTAYQKYFGNTWRTQFNTLYGANLPLGSFAKKPTAELPKTVLNQLKVQYGQEATLTPEELAAARLALAEGGITADAAGYNISGQWVSQRVLASFMLVDDGKDFAEFAEGQPILKLTEQSPKHIIKTLGNSRYGNTDWSKAVLQLNSKGLMTEYLMMTAQENFIRQQTAMVRQRIEAMYAVIGTGSLVEFGKKIQAMQVTADAGKVPTMIDLQLEASGDEYVNTYWGANCTPSASTSTEGSGQPSSASVVFKDTIFIGDSIAEAYRADPKYAKHSRRPDQVLQHLKAAADAGELRGRVVVISTGMSNNIKDRKNVEEQMKILSSSGANVVVLGIAENYKDDIKTANETNQFLRQQAQTYGFGFQSIGRWKAGDEATKAHPKNLTESQFVKASNGNGAAASASCSPAGSADLSQLPNDIGALVTTLKDAITKGEGGSWDAYNTGYSPGMSCKMRSFYSDADVARAVSQGGRRVTQMTLREIADSGKYKICPPNLQRMSANGKYQIMWYNIRNYIKNNPSMANVKFTPEVQEKMVMEFFLMPDHLASSKLFKKGTNLEAAKQQMANTWASICVPGTNHSRYAGQKCSPEHSRYIYGIMDKIALVHKNKGAS